MTTVTAVQNSFLRLKAEGIAAIPSSPKCSSQVCFFETNPAHDGWAGLLWASG